MHNSTGTTMTGFTDTIQNMFNPQKYLHAILEKNARRNLEGKISGLTPQQRAMLDQEDEQVHYVDYVLEEKALHYLVQSETIDRIQFINENTIIGSGSRITDLGDSNGIFIRVMGKDGISVNISDPTVKALHTRGLDTVKADIQYLPFKTNSLDVVFLFQTLEHVPNPILMLQEIARVCRGSLILSIPYVSKTHIHPFYYNPDKPLHQQHIFEFSPEDFSRVITHTPFTLKSDRITTVLDTGGSPLERLTYFLWRHTRERDTLCGCFRKFYLCCLVKRP
ncbi:MAG TPA: class I SAM-dependent methyltransferase [Methanoregula sp.]|nr:class I SAM-dependent methyltransferase [Methanoregula sp.]